MKQSLVAWTDDDFRELWKVNADFSEQNENPKLRLESTSGEIAF